LAEAAHVGVTTWADDLISVQLGDSLQSHEKQQRREWGALAHIEPSPAVAERNPSHCRKATRLQTCSRDPPAVVRAEEGEHERAYRIAAAAYVIFVVCIVDQLVV
jgi:hypothetical protein